MTTEAATVKTPAEIKDEMAEFLLSLGYVHPEETDPKNGIPNPYVTTRENGPKNVTYDLYTFPNDRRDTAAIIVTNSGNDVVVVNFRVGNTDSMLSRYFEVNNIHDRQNTKDFLAKHTR